jgi:hypothetical protein
MIKICIHEHRYSFRTYTYCEGNDLGVYPKGLGHHMLDTANELCHVIHTNIAAKRILVNCVCTHDT